MRPENKLSTQPETLKRCCSAAYETDFARMLLGDSFHPGGLDLTGHLGVLLDLRPGLRILDVASGAGCCRRLVAFGHLSARRCRTHGLPRRELRPRDLRMRLLHFPR